jgi:hypothetical protein
MKNLVILNTAVMLIFMPGGVAAAIQESAGAEFVGSEACQVCHAEQYASWKSSKHANAKNPDAPNPAWTKDGIGCEACHGPGQGHISGQGDISKIASGKEADICGQCHTQRAVLEGKGAEGIEHTRSFHSAVECRSCHMTEGNHLMKVLRPDDTSLSEGRIDTCTACHKDNNRKARAKQLVDWQAWYEETMEPLQAELKAVNALIKENPELLTDALKAKLDGVNSNLSIIVRDGSRGAHNLDYALEIMALAADDLAEIKAAMQ